MMSPARPNTAATIGAIRRHYDEQLTALGFKQPARRSINFPADNPYCDILLISRHERGLDLWNKTNPLPVDPQLSLLLGDEGDPPDEPNDHRLSSSRKTVAPFRGIGLIVEMSHVL